MSAGMATFDNYHHQLRSLKDKSDILRVFEDSQHLLVWRMANQSLYGDILDSLQAKFLKVELAITVTNSKTTFLIDLDNETLFSEVSCLFLIELSCTEQY